MLRTMHWTGLLIVASLMTGCAHMYDVTDDYVMRWKCCHEAKMAWLNCRDLYADVCYPFDFGQGFRAGYQSICMGGDGCRPPMPPRNYWSHHYQCDEGRCQIMAWYDGYHHGALAAQCDGCEGRCQVMCANDIYGQSSCHEDFSELEHKIVPEDEMPPYPPHEGFYPDQMHMQPGMEMHGMPIEIPQGVPMGTPPAPMGTDGVPLAPGASPVGVGTELGPTPVPGLFDVRSPAASNTVAPSF